MTLAGRIEVLVMLGDLEHVFREFRAHLDVAIDVRRFDQLCVLGWDIASLGMKMAGTVRAKLERPLRRVEAGVGEINPEDRPGFSVGRDRQCG